MKHFAARVYAAANTMTESEPQTTTVDGLTINSVKRGVYYTDYFAWINGPRNKWGAGKTRQEAIDSAIRNYNH